MNEWEEFSGIWGGVKDERKKKRNITGSVAVTKNLLHNTLGLSYF